MAFDPSKLKPLNSQIEAGVAPDATKPPSGPGFDPSKLKPLTSGAVAAPTKKKDGILTRFSDATDATLGKASNFLFGSTAKLIGTPIAAGILAANPTTRKAMVESSPEEFSRRFSFLEDKVDKSTGEVAKRTAGEAVGSAAELAAVATGVPGGTTAASRIAKGAAFGAAGGLGQGLQEDKSTPDILKDTASGALTGAAVSGSMELLAKAGDVGAKKFMESALNPYKKDIAKVERLVDDKTLSERLVEKGIVGTNKQVVGKLKALENQTAHEFKRVLAKSPDVRVSGDDLTAGLENVLKNPIIPKDKMARQELQAIIENRRELYKGDEMSLEDLLIEKRGIGSRIGEKGFSTNPVEMRKLQNEMVVDRAIYDNAKRLLEERSGQPELVRKLNQDLSTYIDGINLFRKAQTRGRKLLNFLTTAGAAGVAGVGQTVASGSLAAAAIPAAATGLAVGGTYAALRTTLSKTLNAQLSKALGKAIPSDVAQRAIDRLILELTDGNENTD
jgi:hypothetical protein